VFDFLSVVVRSVAFMSAAEVEPPVGLDAPTLVDPVAARLDAMLTEMAGWVGD